MKQIPIAVQVYSVRQEAEADFAGTMKRLAQMGYDGVELAGLYGKTVEEIGTVLKENGLTAVSWGRPEIWCRALRRNFKIDW